MQLAAAIITALVSLATLGYKVWKSRQDKATLEADLAIEKARADGALLALVKERDAAKERSKYIEALERSIRDHLKRCDMPLADWANALLGETHESSK